MIQPGLPIADLDTNSGKYAFAALSANVKGLVCKFYIIDVSMP